MPEFTVETLYKDRKDFFDLTLLNSEEGLQKRILNAEIHRPGLALTGFLTRFPNQRAQILGETEMTYINQLKPEGLTEMCQRIFDSNIPLVIISKGIPPPIDFLAIADKYKTPVFSSRLTTSELTNRLSVIMDTIFAPSIFTGRWDLDWIFEVKNFQLGRLAS